MFVSLLKKVGRERLSVRLSVRNRIDAVLAELHYLLPTFRKRRFQAYGVGLPKSGTVSLANIFQPAYRAAHEGRPIRTIPTILDWSAGRISSRTLKKRLRYRDKRLQLEFESAHYLHFIIEYLVALFPDSKYVLTYREPLSWMESEINHRLRGQGAPWWIALEEHRYGRYDHGFDIPELERMENVYPMASYLCYWRDHLSNVLATVPPDRLLVVRTSDLSGRLDEIARFVGADLARMNFARSHSHRSKQKLFRLLDVAEKEHLEAQVTQYCGDLIQKRFPALLETTFKSKKAITDQQAR